jgi:hypothetical protein
MFSSALLAIGVRGRAESIFDFKNSEIMHLTKPRRKAINISIRAMLSMFSA